MAKLDEEKESRRQLKTECQQLKAECQRLEAESATLQEQVHTANCNTLYSL
jgi:FtsZ-binding cell division protein ZapB